MNSIISDLNHDIDQKIKNNIKPTSQDRRRLKQRIDAIKQPGKVYLSSNKKSCTKCNKPAKDRSN